MASLDEFARWALRETERALAGLALVAPTQALGTLDEDGIVNFTDSLARDYLFALCERQIHNPIEAHRLAGDFDLFTLLKWRDRACRACDANAFRAWEKKQAWKYWHEAHYLAKSRLSILGLADRLRAVSERAQIAGMQP